MSRELTDGVTVREALQHIEKCKEERHKNPKAKIEVPGLSWAGCSYNKILQQETQKAAPKKSTPMQILIQ
jgi:hypothetical protein